MKLRALAPLAMASAAAIASTLSVGTANAAGTYQLGDGIVSVIGWGGAASCMGFSWWEDNGARSTGTVCGGVARHHFVARPGHWVGLEPRAASDTAISCTVYNASNGQVLYQNSHYWDTMSGSVDGILDTPSNFCMVQLR
ncbi:hypothetical protein [Rhodococcus oryzae]|jgi:hypothetical protein|uniref:hypothetical protein n=1 Tax=Rhodococcus oryzae TaxID=2571143 RepID=UPI0037AF9E8A